MNDSKFIELLNLFLDCEITPDDAKLMESEVQRSPARRRVYREYCEMQKACIVLAEQTETSASAVEFNTPESYPRSLSWNLGSWGIGAYATGFCAAAACLALAVVIRNGNGSAAAAPRVADSASVASIQIEVPAAREQIRREVPLTVSLNPRSTDMHPVFVAQSLALTKQQRDTVASAVPADPRFDWMNRVQITSLQKFNADELLFETRSSLRSDGNTFRGQRPIESQFEKAAFQFQR
jgi:hypothetical protein